MTTTIISTVDNPQLGKQLIAELVKSGLDKQAIEILQGNEKTMISEIVGRGFAEADARGYFASIQDGKTLVAAEATDEQVDSAMAIMERFELPQDDDAAPDADKLLEIEEELAVGKRKVVQGGVRVSRSVTEQPVEESVTLRTETVEVDRRPVSRKLSPAEAEAAFEDKTVEMIGTTEEVEVTKEAHVVGEVALSRQVTEHEQTVKDTVRRTNVDVEKVGTKTRKA